MKKLSIAVLFLLSMSLFACHYGQDEAKQTLERNELYKTEKADYSVNKAGEYGAYSINPGFSYSVTASDAGGKVFMATSHYK